MKPCPVCGEQIQDVAVKCRYCGEILDPALKRRRRAKDSAPWYNKVLVGGLGWAALYMLARMVAGGIFGGIAGGRNPDHMNEAIAEGMQNFENFMRQWHATIIIVSGLVSFASAGLGLLPGTRRRGRS